MKQKIKVFDGIFSHNPYSCLNCDSDYIEWVVNPNEIIENDILFFTDHSLNDVLKYKDIKGVRCYAWLIESPAIIDQTNIINLENYFDNIFTHKKEFIDRNPNKYKLLPVWGSWIKYKDRKIYHKHKDISIIASYKSQTDGHRLRHNVIKLFGDVLDVYGSGYRPVDDKLEALKDYRFSIVIENTKQDYYFSEKLLDCFTTGTIPIYWGCPSVGDFFDINGIIRFDTFDELYEILNEGNFDKLYNEMLPYIKTNFELANKYKAPEDFLINYKNIIIC